MSRGAGPASGSIRHVYFSAQSWGLGALQRPRRLGWLARATHKALSPKVTFPSRVYPSCIYNHPPSCGEQTFISDRDALMFLQGRIALLCRACYAIPLEALQEVEYYSAFRQC